MTQQSSITAKALCALSGHKPVYHLGIVWSSLPREHGVCERCGRTTKFERPTDERLKELEALDDLRDCTNSGCIPL